MAQPTGPAGKRDPAAWAINLSAGQRASPSALYFGEASLSLCLYVPGFSLTCKSTAIMAGREAQSAGSCSASTPAQDEARATSGSALRLPHSHSPSPCLHIPPTSSDWVSSAPSITPSLCCLERPQRAQDGQPYLAPRAPRPASRAYPLSRAKHRTSTLVGVENGERRAESRQRKGSKMSEKMIRDWRDLRCSERTGSVHARSSYTRA